MPWTRKDAGRFTKKAKTPAQKRKWAEVASSVMAEDQDEGKAIRIANAMAKRNQTGGYR